MTVYLFQQYYIPSNSLRKNEIDFCLKCNLKNPHIKTIYLLNEKLYTLDQMGLSKSNWKSLAESKIIQINIGKRLTYLEAFRTMNEICHKHNSKQDSFVLSNSDIFFNGSLRFLPKYLNSKTKFGLCLGRYEYQTDCRNLRRCVMTETTRWGQSQDTWIFHSSHMPVLTERFARQLNFALGKPRCDNRIARIIQDMGLKSINPMKTIKTFHYHSSNYRTYSYKECVPGAILTVKPF